MLQPADIPRPNQPCKFSLKRFNDLAKNVLQLIVQWKCQYFSTVCVLCSFLLLFVSSHCGGCGHHGEIKFILQLMIAKKVTSVHYKFYRHKCVPVLLYGLEVCPLNKADIQSLDFCVNRLLMKLFCTNNLSVIEACRHYFNIASPRERTSVHACGEIFTKVEC